MTYIKINENLYPATINGRVHDTEWDDRASKSITLEMDCETANELFVDGLAWSIAQERKVATYNENGEQDGYKTVMDEFDNSDYNLAGDITDHRDGTITVKMGKLTALEKAYEIMLGGN